MTGKFGRNDNQKWQESLVEKELKMTGKFGRNDNRKWREKLGFK